MIEVVRARHEQRLLALDGVEGVAIGRTGAGAEAIVVYVRDAAARARVPEEIERYPVEVSVVASIDAL